MEKTLDDKRKLSAKLNSDKPYSISTSDRLTHCPEDLPYKKIRKIH